jgi:glycosyltransferase involved in cell wall biosynthesis
VLLRSWTRLESPRIDRWIRPAEVLHATNYLTPPSRLPTIVSVYDCSFVRFPGLCSPDVRAFEPILRRAIARGATVHTGSAFIADEIEEVFGVALRAAGRLAVIPLGVPPLEQAASLTAAIAGAIGTRPYVLAIGTLEPRKNLARLVNAFGMIAAHDSDLQLVLAGRDGPARSTVDAAIMRLPAEMRTRVTLTGGVSDGARRALLEGASVIAYPSIYEGFGFPVLEAMRVGVPVVAARAGSIPEIAGDAALLVEPTDEHALAAAIEQALSDETLRAELINSGNRRIAHFSWSETARGLAACYERLREHGS